MDDERNQLSPGKAKKITQVQPINSQTDLEKEARDVVPLDDSKLMELKNKNTYKSSEELKFSGLASPNSKIKVNKAHNTKKKLALSNSKKKTQRVSFNEQINKIHLVENWKTYNIENSVSKGGSQCCQIM